MRSPDEINSQLGPTVCAELQGVVSEKSFAFRVLKFLNVRAVAINVSAWVHKKGKYCLI
jgi:hypothetical protein